MTQVLTFLALPPGAAASHSGFSATLTAKALCTVLRQGWLLHCHLPTMSGTGKNTHLNSGVRHGLDLGVSDFGAFSKTTG